MEILLAIAVIFGIAFWLAFGGQCPECKKACYEQDWPRLQKGLSEALRRTAPALREIGIEIEFLGHKRDGSYISIKHFLLSENSDHNDHTVTDQPKTQEIQGLCDGVTVVTNNFGKSKKPNGDIQARSEYNVTKYGE